MRSWLRLEPRREVLVFGDEPGVKEMPEVALRSVPDRLEAIDVTVRIRDMAKSADRDDCAPKIGSPSAAKEVFRTRENV